MLVLGPLPCPQHRTFPRDLVYAAPVDPRFPTLVASQRTVREYRPSSLIVRYRQLGRQRYHRHEVCILLSTERQKPCYHLLLTDPRRQNRSDFQFCTSFLQADGLPQPIIRRGRLLVLVQLTPPFPHDTLSKSEPLFGLYLE